MINRILESSLTDRLGTGKALIVLGARQTGKTTLLRKLMTEMKSHVYLNCDEPLVREQLTNASSNELKRVIGENQFVIVDEAQRIPNVGITLKLITDEIPETQLLVSGSSSLDLASLLKEPLTGRKREFLIYPISWGELTKHFGYLDALKQLESRIVFGMYPEVVSTPGNEKEILRELSDSYLYKDLLNYQGIRKPDLLQKLIKVLALQIGHEVSLNEISRMLQVDKNTVSSYIDLLEKAFVVFKLPAFSRNVRNEITRGRKIYFYDTGIRNAVISNFNPLGLRDDRGVLWENFLLSERLKFLRYHNSTANMYFWRTTAQQEIDYVEENNAIITGIEFKWSPHRKARIPKTFSDNYSGNSTTIHNKNFHEFLTEKDIQEHKS